MRHGAAHLAGVEVLGGDAQREARRQRAEQPGDAVGSVRRDRADVGARRGQLVRRDVGRGDRVVDDGVDPGVLQEQRASARRRPARGRRSRRRRRRCRRRCRSRRARCRRTSARPRPTSPARAAAARAATLVPAGAAMSVRPALRAARTNARASAGRRPAIVSGPARLRAPMTRVRVPAGGSGGWARIASIGVARPMRPPYSPIVSEIAPMLRATPSAPVQSTGEPEKPAPRPVASIAGPDTRTMMRAAPPRPRSRTSTTSTPNCAISMSAHDAQAGAAACRAAPRPAAGSDRPRERRPAPRARPRGRREAGGASAGHASSRSARSPITERTSAAPTSIAPMATEGSTTTPALTWDGRALRLLDQTLLPGEEAWIDLAGAADTAAAIARLAVRGAPNIGIAAAYGLAMQIAQTPGDDELRAAATVLREARPTAVNLAWAVDRVQAAALAVAPDAARRRRARTRPRRSTPARTPPAPRSRCSAPTCSPARGGSSRTATRARWRAGERARRSRSRSSSPSATTSPCWPARRARCCRARG